MTNPLLFCFEPIADSNAELLILGSMPGQESLAAGQYYANRRNTFWKIMSDLLEFDPSSSYEVRLQALTKARIALWDVLQSCTRAGSLDSNIDTGSITANDFRSFFRTHDKIQAVFFNGAMAESAYRRYVSSTVGSLSVSYTRLPSTSPAHASLSYEQKLHAWRVALNSVSQNKPV
jgi:TDG/mug DNA glycosylase family protein